MGSSIVAMFLHGELARDIAVIGRLFGISIISAIRVGLLLAPCGEFAFVAFGEAVNQGIMSCQMSSLLFLVVGVSMALTPWLVAGGQLLASRFELHDVRSLLPVESESCHFELMHKYLMMMDEGGEEPLVAIWTRWPDHCAASFRTTYSICCSCCEEGCFHHNELIFLE